MQERKYVRLCLIVASAVVLYFVFRIFQPFIVPVSLAFILASLSYPVFEWTCVKLKGRHNLAALLTCIGVTASIILPFIILLLLLAVEVTQVYQKLQTKLSGDNLAYFLDLSQNLHLAPVISWVSQYIDLGAIDIVGNLTTAFERMSYFFLRHSTSILSGLFQTIVNFLVILFTMFFLFRDGTRFAEELRTWNPLSERYEQQIIEKFRKVADATVFGSLLTAVAQGFAGGLVYWALGISNPLFWAFVTAVLSLVPVVGTALVWVPWAIYFFTTGSVVRGVVLVIAAVLFVGMIDNVIRPLLIEGKAKMHTLVVFFSIMGGIAYFGMLGMIFGPILVAIGLTFVELYKLEFRQELAKPVD